MSRPRAGAALAALAALAPALSGAASLDPARVGWSSVELSARKLFLSASASVTVAPASAAGIGERLRQPPQGQPVAAGAAVTQMTYDATLSGQRTAMTLLLDSPSGRLLQMELLDSGRRQRSRLWRYTDLGAYHWTRWPANDREEGLPPEQWTERSEGLRAYPAPVGTAAVTDAAALLYVLAAAPLEATGDHFDILVFSRRRLHRVSADVAGTVTVAVDYRQQRGSFIRQASGKVPALKVRLRGDPWPAAGDDDDDRFELLGLSDGIELLLDPASRAPLQLSGKAPYVGQVTFRLRAATLR